MGNSKAATMAKNTDEFLEKYKYSRTRYTSSTARRALVLDDLYRAYLNREGRDNSEGLYTADEVDRIVSRVEGEEDRTKYFAYTRLVDWTHEVINSASYRYSLMIADLSCLNFVALAYTSGEHITEKIGQEAAEDDLMETWLGMITVGHIIPTGKRGYFMQTNGLIESTRDEVRQSHRYLRAYNKLIDMIAEEIRIPEYAIYKIDLSKAEKLISIVNDAFTVLRYSMITCRGYEKIPTGTTAEEIAPQLDECTPEELREITARFKPLEEPRPISSEAILYTKRRLHEVADNGLLPWSPLLAYIQF